MDLGKSVHRQPSHHKQVTTVWDAGPCLDDADRPHITRLLVCTLHGDLFVPLIPVTGNQCRPDILLEQGEKLQLNGTAPQTHPFESASQYLSKRESGSDLNVWPSLQEEAPSRASTTAFPLGIPNDLLQDQFFSAIHGTIPSATPGGCHVGSSAAPRTTAEKSPVQPPIDTLAAPSLLQLTDSMEECLQGVRRTSGSLGGLLLSRATSLEMAPVDRQSSWSLFRREPSAAGGAAPSTLFPVGQTGACMEQQHNPDSVAALLSGCTTDGIPSHVAQCIHERVAPAYPEMLRPKDQSFVPVINPAIDPPLRNIPPVVHYQLLAKQLRPESTGSPHPTHPPPLSCPALAPPPLDAAVPPPSKPIQLNREVATLASDPKFWMLSTPLSSLLSSQNAHGPSLQVQGPPRQDQKAQGPKGKSKKGVAR